ncbi:META domain-containing protein [Micromonospora okii]|uniref:META domain-containing protein n=1 Tax=Micromonospora okii TaxID=1182970 RepID=UPI001E5BE289|nr:META domain-containing protein [Micromonospora okii]
MERRSCLAVLAALGVLLAGCDGQTGPWAADSGPDGIEASGPLAPEKLIGAWTISGLDDPGGGTVLHLAHREVQLVGTRCGILGGSWRADTDGVFLADIDSAYVDSTEGVPGCERAAQDTPEWLRRVTAYRFDGAGRPTLLDGRSRPVARLIPGATPTPGPNMLDSALDPPTVTDEARRDLAPAAPLPATLSPADQRRLVGRWVPGSGHRAAYVEFDANGEWRGSDGCNDSDGRWITADGGTLFALAGAVTLVACAASVPVEHWLWTARRAGFDGEALVLLDAQGRETGRLHPAV